MSFLQYILQFPWVEPLGWTLLHFLWQGAVLGLVVWALLRWTIGSNQKRYFIACAGMVTCVILPVVTFCYIAKPFEKSVVRQVILTNAKTEQSPAVTPVIQQPAEAARETESKTSSQTGSEKKDVAAVVVTSARSFGGTIARWMVPLWLIGVVLLGAKLAFEWFRIQWWRSKSEPAEEPLYARFTHLLQNFGITRKVRLLISQTIPVPLTLGWIKPVVVLPLQLLTGLSKEQLEAIIIHELAHIRRYDYLINLVQSAIETLLFYHPVTWWLGREIRQIREECTDALAASACGDRMTYARALANLADLQQSGRLVTAATGGSLMVRLKRLFGEKNPDPLFSSRNAGWLLTLFSATIAAIALVYSARLMAEEEEKFANTKPAPQGVVVDENGAGIPEARVMLYYWASEWGLGNRIVETVQTDAKGKFKFSEKLQFQTPHGSLRTDHYILLASHPNKAVAWDFVVGGTPAEEQVILTLTKPVSQTYEVVDAQGKPMPGAAVWLWDARPTSSKFSLLARTLYLPFDTGFCSATTDQNGRATLNTIPEGKYNAGTSMPGYETQLYGSAAADGVWRFVLKLGGTLEGRVLDPLGLPVKGAKVWLDPKFNYSQYFMGRTDENGRYRIEGIWSNRNEPDWGKYKLLIQHPRFTAEEKEVAFTSGQKISDYDIHVQPGTQIIGKIVEPITGTPVAGATVMIDSRSGRQSFTSDLSGEFRARVKPGEIRVIFYSMPAGTYVIEDRSGEYIQTYANGAEFPLTYTLPSKVGKLGRVKGKVVQADQTAAGVCKVHVLLPSSQRVSMTNWRGQSVNGIGEILSTQEGHFDEAFPIGMAFNILAKTEDGKFAGFKTGESKSAVTELDSPVILKPTRDAEILLKGDGGKSVANVAVSVQPLIEGFRSWSMTAELKTNENGLLKIPNAIPGLKYMIASKDESSVNETVELIPADGAIAPALKEVNLTTNYLLRAKTHDNKPLFIKSVKEYYVYISLPGEPKVSKWTNTEILTTNREGDDVLVPRRTLVLGKSGNKIELLIETNEGQIIWTDGTLPKDGTNIISVTAREPLSPPDTVPDPNLNIQPDEVAGRVLAPDGSPLSEAKIHFEGAWWSRGKEPLKTDKDGVFRIVNMSKNHFTYIRVEKDGFAPAFLTDVTKGSAFAVTLQNTTRFKGTIGDGKSGKVKILLKKDKATKRQEMRFSIRDIRFETETDEAGNYDFPIEAGNYRFFMSSSDGKFSVGETSILPNQIAALPAALKAGETVSLHFVDCQTGKPVSGVEVRIVEQLDSTSHGGRPGSSGASNAEGVIQWENQQPGETRFDIVGKYFQQLVTDYHGYSRWWREDEPVSWRQVKYSEKHPKGRDGTEDIVVDIKENQPPIRVLMEKGVKISGVVIDPVGKPAGGVTIAAVSQDGMSSLGGDSSFQYQTDKEGKFSGYIPAGNGVVYNLCTYVWPEKPTPGANAVSEPFQSKAGDAFEFKLQMSKGGWVTGKITNPDGSPASEVRVSGIAKDSLETAYGSRIAKVAKDGNFRLGPLRASDYEIHLGEAGEYVPLQKFRNFDPKTVTIGDGEEKDIGTLICPPAKPETN